MYRVSWAALGLLLILLTTWMVSESAQVRGTEHGGWVCFNTLMELECYPAYMVTPPELPTVGTLFGGY